MTESKRHRAGSWWGRPGAPISLVLCITVAATVVLIGVLVIDPQPSCPPKCNDGEPSPTVVVVESEDLKAIARAVTAPQNLSITVKLDEEQLDKFGDSATEIASGTRDIASNVKRVAAGVVGISGKVDNVVGGVNRVAAGVVGISGKMDGIAGGVNRVAAGVVGISGSVGRHGGLSSRPRLPLGNWMGEVHFAHASPQEGGDDVSGQCEEISEYLEEIAKNLEKKIEKTGTTEQQCVLVIGYANTLGNEKYNENLSKMRAKIVTKCLTDKVGTEFKSVNISTGEIENKNNLHYPDSWYRAVDVYHFSLCSLE